MTNKYFFVRVWNAEAAMLPWQPDGTGGVAGSGLDGQIGLPRDEYYLFSAGFQESSGS